MTYTLTILDVSGVQNYLFNSNRMAHNLGASYLVEQAMDGWVGRAASPLQHGEIENGAEWERVYSGGGNAVLLFASHQHAFEFTQRYTRRLLQEAPGLRVVVKHSNFEWGESLAQVYKDALGELAEKKSAQTPVLPMLGLSVTSACQYTGLPAVAREPKDDDKRISAEVKAKMHVQGQARERLRQDFVKWLGDYEFTYDFNLLGESGEASFLAVVHTDGNGMGKRKQALCDNPENQRNNRKFINAIRDFSQRVEDAGTLALQTTFSRMMQWFQEDEEGRKSFIAWDDKEKVNRVKFVPLVFGGDDVTFVCDGRIGLSLAAIYLQEFNKYRLGDKPLYACAGVAIVKNRYPFARAYGMAEELCQNAKRVVKDWKINKDDDALALDWHFAVSGAVLDVKEIRVHEYTASDGKLYVRPYFINAPRAPLKSWHAFRGTVHEFKHGKGWSDKRNKVKELREQLRRGKDATNQFLRIYGLGELPMIPDASEGRQDGWVGDTCAYFDAIEAMDLFHDVEPLPIKEST
ncbi:MAG TPA: hypothetical protein VFD70_11045 [Anaerolineae bacterium]|nr:hypothetical protein [Anaerolineae bacterium]